VGSKVLCQNSIMISLPRQTITPFLWLDNNAEAAAAHYISVFDNSRLLATTYYEAGGPQPAGSVMTVSFQLAGQAFTALNGGSHFKINPAISFVIHCDTQAELDHYTAALSHAPEAEQCGWVQDRFGVSWQIVPRALIECLTGTDSARKTRMMAAMMGMRRLNLAQLLAA
jgi:predicted 3-demethylubiquinone-9 3-methyltransferase (glyoxalase superfamily)